MAHGDFVAFEKKAEEYAQKFMDGRYWFDYSEYSRQNWVLQNVCCLLSSVVKVMINKLFNDKAYMPTRAHASDAGIDLYAPKGTHTVIYAGGAETFDTGVSVQIPEGWCGIIVSKSGLNTKYGIVSCGLIDSGYTGTIRVKLYNHGTEPFSVDGGMKISQLVVVPCMLDEPVLVDSLPDSERGNNGFGSTGA